jgi:hypothetical protein
MTNNEMKDTLKRKREEGLGITSKDDKEGETKKDK